MLASSIFLALPCVKLFDHAWLREGFIPHTRPMSYRALTSRDFSEMTNDECTILSLDQERVTVEKLVILVERYLILKENKVNKVGIIPPTV